MSTSAVAWNKRSLIEHGLESPIQSKKGRYWFRLASESSSVNTDDTESVCSLQDRETDVVKDTTDTQSDTSEYDIDIEYEIGSLSDDDDREMIILDSSDDCDNEGMIYAAAVVGDSSLETFVTDAEDSDNSRQDDSSSGLTDFWICIQCKSQNDNPQYRFCEKCFQGRKAIFPPRPRPRKKADRRIKEPHAPVEIGTLRTCLKTLSEISGASPRDSGISSQDSGIGSSQEFPMLRLDEIKVPTESKPSSSLEEVKNRKRQHSESSLSEFETKRPKKQPKIAKSECEESKKEKCEEKKVEDKEKVEDDKVKKSKQSGVISEPATPARTKSEEVKGGLPELNEDCIMCNEKPKNSVFLHGRIAHMCCCYRCAMRAWRSLKRCPICKRKVSNVVRVFTT